MHITDWFSTTWNSVLGHKSSGIVDDFYWRPNEFISGYLSGNFDPNNTGSYNGGSDYNNLKSGDDLCIFNNMSFISGSGIGDPSYFESDGADDFIASCSLGGGEGYASNFIINLNNDYTISVWTAMDNNHGARIWSIGSPNAGQAGDDPGIELKGYYDAIRLEVGSPNGSTEFHEIGDGRYSANKHGRSEIKENRWYHFTFVFDKSANDNNQYQFYIDGAKARVFPSGPYEGYSGIGIQYIAFGADQMLGSPQITTEGHKFGHIHFYNKALKHSEVRQNYLATNQYYYTTSGNGYGV